MFKESRCAVEHGFGQGLGHSPRPCFVEVAVIVEEGGVGVEVVQVNQDNILPRGHSSSAAIERVHALGHSCEGNVGGRALPGRRAGPAEPTTFVEDFLLCPPKHRVGEQQRLNPPARDCPADPGQVFFIGSQC